MGFKRYEGFMGSLPQKFVDNKLPICPVCGDQEPKWAIDEKMGWVNRYLFQCAKCKAILSASVPDVTGFSKTPVSIFGMAKMLDGKKLKTVYFKLESFGDEENEKLEIGKEIGLDELNEIAKS